MGGLSAADIAGMKRALDTLMPSTCTITAPTYTATAEGGFSTAWGTTSVSIPCRLESQGNSGRLSLGGGAIEDFHGWILTVPDDTVITTAHRVEVGGNTYTVKGVDNVKSWKGQIRCNVEAI